jgi:26 proteasome complex subunit DSS1
MIRSTDREVPFTFSSTVRAYICKEGNDSGTTAPNFRSPEYGRSQPTSFEGRRKSIIACSTRVVGLPDRDEAAPELYFTTTTKEPYDTARPLLPSFTIRRTAQTKNTFHTMAGASSTSKDAKSAADKSKAEAAAAGDKAAAASKANAMEAIEEDDEFEEFQDANWGASEEDAEDTQQWQDNWDADDMDDDFTKNLREELMKNST